MAARFVVKQGRLQAEPDRTRPNRDPGGPGSGGQLGRPSGRHRIPARALSQPHPGMGSGVQGQARRKATGIPRIFPPTSGPRSRSMARRSRFARKLAGPALVPLTGHRSGATLSTLRLHAVRIYSPLQQVRRRAAGERRWHGVFVNPEGTFRRPSPVDGRSSRAANKGWAFKSDRRVRSRSGVFRFPDEYTQVGPRRLQGRKHKSTYGAQWSLYKREKSDAQGKRRTGRRLGEGCGTCWSGAVLRQEAHSG